MTASRFAFLPPILGVAAVITLWQVLSVTGVFPAELPPGSAVAVWLAENLTTSELWAAVGLTLLHWASALLLGVLIGAVVGGLMATIPLVGDLLTGLVEFFRPIPVVVYLPVMLLLLGARSQVVIILVAVAATWPMLVQTLYGVRAIDPVTQDTARVYGLTGYQRLRWVTVPSVLPYAMTGIRLAATITLLAAIAVELIGGIPGLGNTLNTYAANGIYEAIYGVIVITGLIGLLLNVMFERLERRALRWHTTHRRAAR